MTAHDERKPSPMARGIAQIFDERVYRDIAKREQDEILIRLDRIERRLDQILIELTPALRAITEGGAVLIPPKGLRIKKP